MVLFVQDQLHGVETAAAAVEVVVEILTALLEQDQHQEAETAAAAAAAAVAVAAVAVVTAVAPMLLVEDDRTREVGTAVVEVVVKILTVQ